MKKQFVFILIISAIALGLVACHQRTFDNPLDAQSVPPGGLSLDSHERLIIYKEVATSNGLVTMYSLRDDDLDCVSVTFVSENEGQWRAESSGSTCGVDRTVTNLDTFKGRLAVLYGFVPTQATYMQIVWDDGVTMQTDVGRDGVILLPRYDKASPESFVLYDETNAVLESGRFSEQRLDYRSPSASP